MILRRNRAGSHHAASPTVRQRSSCWTYRPCSPAFRRAGRSAAYHCLSLPRTCSRTEGQRCTSAIVVSPGRRRIAPQVRVRVQRRVGRRVRDIRTTRDADIGRQADATRLVRPSPAAGSTDTACNPGPTCPAGDCCRTMFALAPCAREHRVVHRYRRRAQSESDSRSCRKCSAVP